MSTNSTTKPVTATASVLMREAADGFPLRPPFPIRHGRACPGHPRRESDRCPAPCTADPLPSTEQLRLKDLSARRRQLIHMRTSELNRQQQASLKDVSKSIRHVITTLDREIAKIEKQVADLIDSNSDWKKKADLMDSVKGIGAGTAHAILAELPEIGTLSKRQVASLAGLAPHAFESGQFKGKSKIWGGRATVRCALFMGTLAATRSNPPIKRFYDRLIAQGKKKMVALTACMRKLLTILNAIVRTGVKWNPEFAND